MNPEWEEREYMEQLQAQESAREQFVRQWRERHTAWTDSTWRCPLCNRILQAYGAVDVMYGATQHQIDHGQDWLDYQAIGALPAGHRVEGTEGGRMSEHDISRIVAAPRHDWTGELRRLHRAPGVYSDEEIGVTPNLERYQGALPDLE